MKKTRSKKSRDTVGEASRKVYTVNEGLKRSYVLMDIKRKL
jgi:hypothetical protein